MFWKQLGDCCNGWVTNTFLCKLYSLTAKKRCVKEQQIASVTNKPTQEQLEGSTDAIVQHKPLRKAFKGGHNWTYTGLEKLQSHLSAFLLALPSEEEEKWSEMSSLEEIL